MTSTQKIAETTHQILDRWGRKRSTLLQVLIRLQQKFQHVPDDAIALLSDELSVSVAEIRGVISFYSFLHFTPRGNYDLLISDNIIDRMSGGRELGGTLKERFREVLQQPDGDRNLSLDYTACTGMSDQGPAALVNGRALTNISPTRTAEIVELVNNSVPVDDWPEEFFLVRNNIHRKGLLLGNELEPGSAIKTAFEAGAEASLETVIQSGLRGRGGAGFSTGDKWRFCRDSKTGERVVVCNADEGEPGTFKDRVLLQEYADRLLEGMTICAFIIGAEQGFIYLRGEYLYLLDDLEKTIRQRRNEGLLGEDILGRDGFNFDIEVHLGAGAYICGEESALIESLEGKRGNPRIRPPFPVTSGYLGLPTVVNNVETLVAAAMILDHGSEWFRSKGTPESAGSKLLSVSGDCERPGIYEYSFGVTVAEVLEACGAESVGAVQLAGPAGHLIPPSEFNRRISFEDLATGGSFMVFSEKRNLLDVIENFVAFFVHESCGFCTPCRVGTSLIKKRLKKIGVGHGSKYDVEMMERIGRLMQETSHCGLGSTAPNSVLDSIRKFPEIYQQRISGHGYEPGFDLDRSLDQARRLAATGKTGKLAGDNS